MKVFKIFFLITIANILLTTNVFSQKIKTEELPEYIIITAENTKLLGGIGISIDWKKSPYKSKLQNLVDYLEDERRVRNLTDLFNVMFELGFDYKDAFNADAGTLGVGAGDDLNITGSDSKYRSNIVFKKYKK